MGILLWTHLDRTAYSLFLAIGVEASGLDPESTGG